MTTQLTIETFPNEAAAAYIRGKAVADPKNFGALPDQLKQRAFTVAGIEQLYALRKIRDAVAKLPEGASWDEAKKDVAEKIAAYTGVDMKAARARAEMQLRVHGFQAYSVARHQQQMATVARFPYWKYETVGDNRVRASHAALDGKVLRADDPWWKTHYPPWDWGCRCIVVALDEEDAKAIGITERSRMPTPERSGSFSFDPTNVAIDLDALAESYKSADKSADWKLFAAKCRQATVQANGREPETMWELMLDNKMQKTAKALAGATDIDGKERAVVRDFMTSRKIGKPVVGDANSVKAEIAADATVCTLHTHPNGDNTPSPADLLLGYHVGSKVDYIAAGKQLRRWQWLKTPTKIIADKIVAFDKDNNAGRIDRDAYEAFLSKLAADGYIKMEDLS